MRNQKDSRQRRLLSLLAVLLTACLLFFGFRIYTMLDQYFGKVDASKIDTYAYQNGGRPEYFVDGKWYVQKKNVETYLLIGIDKYESAIMSDNGYRNKEQSDALFLLAVDRGNKTYSIIHINRDTMANIRMLDVKGNPYNSFEGQLALSHTYGSGREDSCENTVWSVSDYLYGLQIDHYASFSMDAVAVLNDQIGGVTLTVLDDMTVIDGMLKEGESVTLKGEQALTYIRSRQGLANSTNLERMKRQRQYVDAFLEQTRAAIEENDSLVSDMLASVSEYLVSDLTASKWMTLSDVLHSYTYSGIATIDGEARKGEQYMEFRADEAALKKLVIDTFFVEK